MTMKKISGLLVTTCLVLQAAAALAAPEVGQPAPAFTAAGSDSKMHSLADYRGKYVVLEWLNHECPYVRKHYDTKNMQALQEQLTGKDVVWVSVISSAPGKQGHSTAAEANANTEAKGAHPTVVILDEEGEVGRAYEAKTTPHMFVIDPEGTLIYKGAIDDQPSFDQATVAAAKNYVRQGTGEAMSGKPVSEPVTQPYGCSIKY